MQHTKKGAIMEIVMKAPKKLSVLQDKFQSEVEARAEQFSDTPEYLAKNYIMLHGSSYAWEIPRARFIKTTHLAESAYISYKIWRSSPRKFVDIENVVFDPKGKFSGRDDYINKFTGIEARSKKGDATPWVFHIKGILCAGDEAASDFLLKWMAYPLQHVGAKMTTSPVVHGIQGTGKNLIVKPLKEIYGKWYQEVGQAELNRDFNDWAKSKLFITANEVISGTRDLNHLHGKLKALISEDTIIINEKNQPIISEANHANLIFLSNEDTPVKTDSSDRRFLVIKCNTIIRNDDGAVDDAYYTDLKNVSHEAIYDYLLNLDLGDFNEHSKPPVTQAKKDLIRLNMKNQDEFVKDWLEGNTLFPFQNVPSSELYWAYRCWCAENGERPCTAKAFSSALTNTGINKSYASYHGTTAKALIYFIDEIRFTVISMAQRNSFEAFKAIVNNEKLKYKLQI
jgi:hypothetical protein